MKNIKNKNRRFKSVNNHKIQIYHKLYKKNHIVSKGWAEKYSELSLIYRDLQSDFERVDLIDLEFYERWLNG